jgi:hypothetical protein
MSPSSTSNSEPRGSRHDRRAIARFVLRALVFCAPLLAGALLFEVAMYRTRDSWPIEKVIAAQQEAAAKSGSGESLLGRANFSQQYNLSKSLMVQNRRPSILALGSSRVMEFRSFMFHPHEAEFYNAGGLIQNVNDLAEFARQVRQGKRHAPRVIIIGIDPWWVSEATDPVEKKSWLVGESDAVYSFSSHVEAARYLLRAGKSTFPWAVAFGGRAPVSPAYNYPAYGITAISAGIGERFSDGSFLYTAHLQDFLKHPVYRDRLAMPVLDQVKRRYFLFAPTSRVEPVRASMLVQSLVQLKQAGIEVYAYLPPFASEVRRALDESQELRVWWSEYKEQLPQRLAAEGIPCLSVASPADYGLDDTYMFDAIHPGELLDARIVEDLARRAPPGSLLGSIDLNYLSALREKEGTIPLAFEPPPPGVRE